MENSSAIIKIENVQYCDGKSNGGYDSGSKKCATVPTIFEWEQLWYSWDTVSRTMIDHNNMLLEQPIGLRHPFIFYLGHIPAFLDIMITRHKVDQVITNEEQPLTEPAEFADIFERGIDPDMDDPTNCNPHSQVPEEGCWPSSNEILQYQQLVRNRLRRLLFNWKTEDSAIQDESVECIARRQRAARVVWMCFEHEAMHLETLLYMLVQSPNMKHPPVSPPSWYKQQSLQNDQITKFSVLDRANMLTFDGANVEIGHDDPEDVEINISIDFGWDNEHPKRVIAVQPFEIQSRPITNGEYLLFWKENNYDKLLFPASWYIGHNHKHNDQLPKVRTSFGLCEFHPAINWPVEVSCQQAEMYAASTKNGMRLPTEPEWIHFRRTMETKLTQDLITLNGSHKDLRNYGFRSWTPQPLNNQQIHTVGDVWEWTSTIWDHYEGFQPSQLYPGYSADFFDGKHRVVLGGSWATLSRIAERITFRNWYQWRYPYVFCGFRLCRSL